MPYVSTNPAAEQGNVVGDGQCVAYVRATTYAPPTAQWREGIRVKGALIKTGTAIATFKNGVYPSQPTGQHAAIYVGQNDLGIEVWDQWVVQPVHKRAIRFKGGAGNPSNDADAFSVIE